MIFTEEEQAAFTAYTNGLDALPELMVLLPPDFLKLLENVRQERWDDFTEEDFEYFLAFSQYIHELAIDELSRRGVFLSEATTTKH